MNAKGIEWPKIQQLTGSVVAMVTPMKTDDHRSVDLEAFRNLLRWQIKNSSQGILVMGTTGENPTLDESEYDTVLATTVACAKENADCSVPVFVGTGSNSTRIAIARTLKAKKLGADCALIVTPYYNKPSQEGLLQHYTSIAKACPDFPIILYNVPSRTGCDLLPSTVAKLSQIPNIVGTKESSGKFERYVELSATCKSGFRIFSGEDAQAIPAILCGSGTIGVFSVTANVAPHLVQMACQLALKGAKKEAKRVHEQLMPLHQALFMEPSPSAAKYILESEGKIPGGIRLPLVRFTDENQQKLVDIYKKATTLEKN